MPVIHSKRERHGAPVSFNDDNRNNLKVLCPLLNGWNSLSEGVPSLRGISTTCFWRRRSSKVCFTLNLWLQYFRALLSIPFFCLAKEAKAPAHGTHQAALPLFRSCLCGNILQSVASLVARVFSSVFRVLRNSFSYPHFVRITNTQTVIAFGELWLHSLYNLQVNLRYARLHKLSSFSSNHWRRLPKSLMRTEKAMNILIICHCIGNLKK